LDVNGQRTMIFSEELLINIVGNYFRSNEDRIDWWFNKDYLEYQKYDKNLREIEYIMTVLFGL
jgi:hypothetical protein